ncbi:flagellar motor protein MotB [Chitinophaga silvatica]|uniref:Flagellar motor protein MotB n=1 Tax=Chitinophaga silvatica TaxID=2282649 RepID=A0A3E1YDN6_9BACT|nr:OmpA family protein [Chitinophaga silvatica]RFS24584.1 flagellar motor protein MotB [Chitinophaga silvatica]
MKHYILPFLLIALSFSLKAQTVTYETAPKKAVASFDKAIEAARVYEYKSAINYLQEALKTAPNFADAYGQMGLCYVEMKNYAAAKQAFEKLIQLDNNGLKMVMVPYSKALAGTGNFKEALDLINQYLSIRKSPAAEKLKENYSFAVNNSKNIPFQPQNMGDAINSKDGEYFPTFTIDSRTLIFTRRINGRNEDFFITHRDDQNRWSTAVNMGEPINSSYNEGAQNLSQDGTLLIFTGCDFPEGKGSCDLYYSEKTSNGWTAPKNMGPAINTRDWESQPSLSADKQTLYFSRETQTNGSDIYVSQRLPNGQWGVAQPLGPNINTTGHERTPFIHPDGQTLYFASNGHPGYGNMDIYYSRRQPDGSWGPAINIGYPINTIDEDASLVVDANGTTAYFASERSDSRGSLDIYSFELYPEARPLKTLYVKGYVYDSLSHDRLTAKVEVIDLQTGNNIATVNTDVTGFYLAPLPVEHDYAVNVNKKGYLFYSDNFSLKDHPSTTSFEKNIPLQSLALNASVVLHNIFFDSNKFDLKPESVIELERLVALLKENPEMKIQIAGYTDNVGSDQANQVLSANRAASVVKYLTSKGITAERLSSKGFGKSEPVASNDTEEGRAQNRRTVFKVTSL